MTQSIFGSPLKWTPVQTQSDANIRAIQELAKTQDSMVENFGGITKSVDEVFADAQRNRQAEFLANVQQLPTETLLDSDKMYGLRNAFINQGNQIGGYNNIAEFDLVFDGLKGKRIADDKLLDEYQSHVENTKSQRLVSAIEATESIANNFGGQYNSEQQQQARAELDNMLALVTAKNPDGTSVLSPTEKNAVVKHFTGSYSRIKDNTQNQMEVNEVLGKQAYNSELSAFADNHIFAVANISEKLKYARAKGDTEGVEVLTKELGRLQEAEREMFNNPNISNLAKNKYRSLFSDKFANYSKQISDSESKVAAHELDIANLKQKAALNNQDNATKLAVATINADVSTANNRQDNATKFEIALANAKAQADKNNPDSFSGSKTVEKVYGELGISNPVLRNANGTLVLNKDGINSAINNKLHAIYNPDLSKELAEAKKTEYALGSNWFDMTTKNRADFYEYALDARQMMVVDALTGKSRPMSRVEKDMVILDTLLTKGERMGMREQSPSAELSKTILKEYRERHDNTARALLKTTLSTLTQDIPNMSETQLIKELGWDKHKEISRLLK